MGEVGAEFYRARAAEMHALADRAQTEAHRKSFLQLEANWLRLAEQAEKPKPHCPDSQMSSEETET
jgi:hypothetical protein